jgi:hypothetical protein
MRDGWLAASFTDFGLEEVEEVAWSADQGGGDFDT